jgi:hypothetical protein
MKKYRGLKYAFRPKSYWDDEGVLAALLRNVKGAARRELIIKHFHQGTLETLPEVLLNQELPDGVRMSLGRLHPCMMGGEYLPDFSSGEVEIARISLQSTTFDVVSIRARPHERSIAYRIVDEYGEEFDERPEFSEQPFSLEELIGFLDNSGHRELWHGGISVGYNEYNLQGGADIERIRYFTTISSDIYLQLKTHYQRFFEDWYRERKIEIQEYEEELERRRSGKTEEE